MNRSDRRQWTLAACLAVLAGYVDAIVKSNMLSKEAADALPMAAAKEMAANAKKPKAASLNAAFNAHIDAAIAQKGA